MPTQPLKQAAVTGIGNAGYQHATHISRLTGSFGDRKVLSMERSETLANIEQMMGEVPGWLESLPDEQLERRWADMTWINGDTALTSREKKLVAFGAAVALHCTY